MHVLQDPLHLGIRRGIQVTGRQMVKLIGRKGGALGFQNEKAKSSPLGPARSRRSEVTGGSGGPVPPGMGPAQ